MRAFDQEAHIPQRRLTVMRFLSMIRIQETDRQPGERLMNEMGKLMDEMTRRPLR